MRRSIRGIIAIVIIICLALSGCKKGAKNNSKDIDNKSLDKIIKNTNEKIEKGLSTTKDSDTGDNSTEGSQVGGITSLLKITDNDFKAPPKINGVVKSPEDGIGIAGVDYVELSTGPSDDWTDIREPYFNPLGSRALYYNSYYYEDGGHEFEILDNNYINTFYVEGEEWNMRIENPDFSVLWLRAYAKKLGATMYETTGDSAVFHVMENEAKQYWIRADIDDRGAYIYVIYNSLVPIGKTFTIKPADYNKQSMFFYTDCIKGKLQSVTITLKGSDNSGVKLDCYNDRTYGVYKRLLRKEMGSAEDINTKKTNTFIFDDVPLSEGQLKWTLDWTSLRGTLQPTEITFKIDNIADIEPVHYGEDLGMIRVVGVPLGEVELLAGDHNENRHPDYNADPNYTKGNRDKDGNTCFSLPSGYYSIRFANSNEWGRNAGPPLSINSPGVMRLIPVNAGEITTVTIPKEIKLAYSQLQKQYGTFDSAGNIEITDNKDNGDTATVSIIINDPLDRDIFPEKEDIIITEDGLKGKVTDIQREIAPADVVLVLDSSGSMGNNMSAAVEAAKKFVDRLPDNTNIRLVQFEQNITEHKAKTKGDVIKALNTIKAKGGTALYDATDTALKLLVGKKKPYVVLFADGADGREVKNSGKGSDLSKDQIITKIKSSGATVLSIGFGEGHDPRVLVEMSKASKDGAYFAAMKPEALDQAFAAVSGKFGNQFTISYERPTAIKDVDSDTPVISFMIDRSGSMDMDPKDSENDVDYRLDITKNMFHDFVMDIPQGTLMQLGTFFIPPMNPDHVYYEQITTDQKAPVLQGIGQMHATGGTPIVSALKTAHSYLSSVPSSKKTLIYFTDAALAGRDELEKVQIEDVLADMKRDGFKILFAGLGNDEFASLYEEAFSKAASLSGGEYIITDNIDDIRKKLDELMNRINQPVTDDGRMSFTIALNSMAEDGSRMDYSANKYVENFSVREEKGHVIKPDTVKISTGEKYIRYNKEGSALLYGADRPNVDTTVVDYIPYETTSEAPGNFTEANQEMKLKVIEAYYMTPFKGLEFPYNMQALALNVEICLVDNAPIKEYMIPSIFRHFYVSFNNIMYPASEATWLAQTPLTEPGNPSFTLTDNTKLSGIIVFIVTRDNAQRVDQLSLHFYDTNYGHISLPLTGSIPDNALNIDALPSTSPEKLSDTFSLSINGKSDVTKLAETTIIQSTGDNGLKNTSFRVLEGGFTSNVQALLNIDPTERLLYAIETDQGPLVTKMSDIVYHIPMGFTGSTMMAPGAIAPVRMPYQVPNKLIQNSSYIFADIHRGSVNIPVTKGTPLKTGGLNKKWNHEYFDITINALRRESRSSYDTIVLDLTISDIPDGYGTKDLAGLLALSRTVPENNAKHFGSTLAVGRSGIGNFSNSFSSPDIVAVNKDTDNLLYSAYTDFAVLDGASRRGILLFRLPSGANISEWKLTCGVIEQPGQPIEQAYYANPELLAKKQFVDRNIDFEIKLRELVSSAIAKYQSTRTNAEYYNTLGLSKEENVGRQSITPSMTIHGSIILESVKTFDDFLKIMYSLDCVISGDRYEYVYSPEAVITQGWGTELDMARLAMDILSRLGYQPRIVTVKMTKSGLDNLLDISGRKVENYIPGIAYQDASGNNKVFVIPFMRDISELNGIAYISRDIVYASDFYPLLMSMRISVNAQIIKQPGGQAQVEAFNGLNAMFGDDSDVSTDKAIYEDVMIFEKDIAYTDMSLDSVDISYARVGMSADGQNEIITALVETKQGILFNDKLFIDTSFYDVKSITVDIDGYSDISPHTTYLMEGQKLSDVFQTLAFNVPGITKVAANTLQTAVNTKAKEGKEAGDYATVKWIGHATVNRFVRNLTAFEEENAPLFEVKTARLRNHPLALMVTMVSNGEKARATVDIMQHQTMVYNEAANENKSAFSSMLGLYVSIMEGYALGEDKAVGFLQAWTQLPKDTPIFVITKDNMESFADSFEANDGPPKLVEHLRNQAIKSDNAVYLVPKGPSVIEGKEYFYWLEITYDYYGTKIISVSETGEHSAMAEYVVLNAASFGVKPLSAEGVAGFIFGIACIDWSIASFALTTDDYASIMAQAKVLSTAIGDLLANMETATSLAGILGESFGDVQKQIEALEASYKILSNDNNLDVDLAAIHEASKNLVLMPTYEAGATQKHDLAGSASGYSFSDGFKKAVEAYFPKETKDKDDKK